MSNTKRARIQNEDKRLLMRMTWLAIKLDDKQFDTWLLKVVQSRAEKGSVRAQEMIATLETGE